MLTRSFFFLAEPRFLDYFVLSAVFIFFLYQLYLPKSGESQKAARDFRRIFLLSAGFILGYYLFLTYLQFWVWKSSGPLTRFFLPPYVSFGFLFDYWFIRFLLGYAISFLIALALIFSARRLNRRFGGRFFEPEEIWLGALGAFLSGHPGWLIYFGLVFGLQLLRMIWDYFKQGASRRLSFYYLWLPAAMFVIILRVLGVIG